MAWVQVVPVGLTQVWQEVRIANGLLDLILLSFLDVERSPVLAHTRLDTCQVFIPDVLKFRHAIIAPLLRVLQIVLLEGYVIGSEQVVHRHVVLEEALAWVNRFVVSLVGERRHPSALLVFEVDH